MCFAMPAFCRVEKKCLQKEVEGEGEGGRDGDINSVTWLDQISKESKFITYKVII